MEKSFRELYPTCEMNLAVQFIPLRPEEVAEAKSGAVIGFSIHNTSSQSVIFPDNFNVKILRFDSERGNWIEIKNDANYVASTDPYSILEPANSGLGSYSVVLSIPKLSDDVVTAVRVIITGSFSEGNEKAGECVGAFIDTEISP
jgi:hypothetical protein